MSTAPLGSLRMALASSLEAFWASSTSYHICALQWPLSPGLWLKPWGPLAVLLPPVSWSLCHSGPQSCSPQCHSTAGCSDAVETKTPSGASGWRVAAAVPLSGNWLTSVTWFQGWWCIPTGETKHQYTHRHTHTDNSTIPPIYPTEDACMVLAVCWKPI